MSPRVESVDELAAREELGLYKEMLPQSPVEGASLEDLASPIAVSPVALQVAEEVEHQDQDDEDPANRAAWSGGYGARGPGRVCGHCACTSPSDEEAQLCYRNDGTKCCQAICEETGTRCQRRGKWTVSLCSILGKNKYTRSISNLTAKWCNNLTSLPLINFAHPKMGDEACCSLCTQHGVLYIRRLLKAATNKYALPWTSKALVNGMVQQLLLDYPGLTEFALIEEQMEAQALADKFY